MSGRVIVVQGDAAHLPLPDESVDAVVCDPPYGLADLPASLVAKAVSAWLSGDRDHVPDGRGFMSREWDRFVPPPAAWDEALRVLKPGGHLLAFAAPRTADLMGLSIRLAGFEIRDGVHWLYGGGFPKSLDVSKAIDKAAGAERAVAARGKPLKRMIPGAAQNRTGSWVKDNGREFVPEVTEPATEDAERWSGWGTALKPAHEPIVLARKPLEGTVAQNVMEHGTGALNIAGCRVAAAARPLRESNQARQSVSTYGDGLNGSRAIGTTNAGRWPPNVLLGHTEGCEHRGVKRVRGIAQGARRGGGRTADSDYRMRDQDRDRGYADADGMETVEAWDCVSGCPVAELDRQSGVRVSGKLSPHHADSGKAAGTLGAFAGAPGRESYGDAGGASRFFPVFRYEAKADASERPRLPDGTVWPTVKPVALMRWLIRLVTPPGGTVLDPFSGTGTTGQAALIEGFNAVLVDRDPQAIALTRVRLAKPVQPDLFGGLSAPTPPKAPRTTAPQPSLFDPPETGAA